MEFGRSNSVGKTTVCRETRRHRIEEEKKDGRKEDNRQQLHGCVRLGLDETERRRKNLGGDWEKEERKEKKMDDGLRARERKRKRKF